LILIFKYISPIVIKGEEPEEDQMKTKMEQFPATNPNPVVSVGKDGRVLYSNAAGEPLLREWGVVVGEKLPSYIGDLVQRVISLNSSEKMEVKAGNRLYVVSFHHLPEEECVNIYGFDISDQKELGERFQASEKKYRNIVETTNEGVWTFNAVSETTYVNEKMAEMLGYNREELIGRFIWDFADEEDKGIFQVKLANRKQGIDEVYELKLIRGDGSYFWVLISAKAFFDECGKFAGSLGMFTDITERKKMEEALRLSNIYNRSLIEASLDPLVTIGRDGKITDVNGSTEQITGYSGNDLIGTDFSDYFTEPEKASTGYKQVFIDDEVRDYPLEIQHKDGHLTPVLYNASVYKNENGEVIGVFASARNMAGLKKAEEALKKVQDNLEKLVQERTIQLEKAYNSLKESEAGLAEAQRIAHIGSWDWDLVNGVVNWSDELYRIYGRDPHKSGATYDELLNYVHPDDRDNVDNVIKKGLNGEPHAIDYRIILANGEERTVHSQAEVIFDEVNIPIQVKGVIQDITEHKKSEEKIQILANIVESSNDAIGTISLDGIITSWNTGAEQVYGYSAEEILGKPISIIAPPHLNKETQNLSEKIKQGEQIHRYETLRLRKNEKMICVSITLSPVFDTHRELTAVSFISRDITMIKEAEEKFIQEKQIAEVANRAKSEFLANMSHELRTPLNSIIGFSDLLYEQAYGELNEKQLRSVENVSKSGKHLLNLINDILDISKVEAGKLELDYNDFELAAKFNIIRNLLSPIADRKNIKIEIEVDSKLKSIRAGEDRFVQIMYNLVDNAIKFSYEKGLVRIEARKKGDLVEIMVKDTGIGIKAEDQDKLFKPFSQIGPFSSKISQGTGLGLSLVKQIVHLHGGYIWFRSNLGEGSTFAFTIPLTNNKENRGYIELNQNV
jgi:PAS domain S-box-containing protein